MAVISQMKDSRPPPPEDLSEKAQEEWQAVTRRLPPDWFPRESHGVLRQYCEHVVTAQQIQKLLDGFNLERLLIQAGGLDRWDALLKLRERETRAIATLATRMRLTAQSRYDPRKAAGAANLGSSDGSKPWDPVDQPRRRARA